jgi:hypothetical protein
MGTPVSSGRVGDATGCQARGRHPEVPDCLGPATHTLSPVTAPARQLFDYRSYVLLEEDSVVKHEFLDGEVWAMAGGSPERAAITVRIGRSLGNQLDGRPCQVYGSDLRLRVAATGLTT